MTVPDDGDCVLSAIRLGWYVAEVSGRNNPNCPQPRAGETRKVAPSPLPLRNERTAEELETEAEGVLVALATKVLPADGAARAEEIRANVAALRRHRDPEDTDALRAALNRSIFKLDTAAQDGLTAVSDTQACGYLLGRGLAECYWALDLTEPDESWAAGPRRGTRRRADPPRRSPLRLLQRLYRHGRGRHVGRLARHRHPEEMAR